MKKRLLGILLSFALMLTMMPAMCFAAFADEETMPEGVETMSTDDEETAPEGAETMSSDVETMGGQSYLLWVGGEEVTSENTSGDGWSYEPSTNTLTLKGAKISSNEMEGIQYNNTSTPLKIALSPGTVNEVVTTRSGWPAIGPANGGISISGSGELKVLGKRYGIHAGSLTIESGTINIEASEEDSLGIFSIFGSPVTINGGNVTVTGKKYAIAKANNSSGGVSKPVTGSVKNAITGTGWTDTAGTQGETVIPVNKEGQTLGEYKKVQFGASPAPAPATSPLTVTTTAKPSAKSMTVKWTWNSVAGAKKYKVSYRKVGKTKWTTKTTKKTKYVIKGHKINGLYEYKVAAVTASGDVWSDVNCRYFKRVKATAKAGKAAGTVKASWKKDKGATGYKVLLATNKKMNNAQAVEVSADQKSYTFSGLKSGKKYYVKVRPLKNYNGVTYQGIYTKALRAKTK